MKFGLFQSWLVADQLSLVCRYGNGYSAAVSCPPQRVDEARELLLAALPGSTAVEQHLHRLKMHVPLLQQQQQQQLRAPRLADLFRALDEARRGGSVLDYTVQQTTLEDVSTTDYYATTLSGGGGGTVYQARVLLPVNHRILHPSPYGVFRYSRSVLSKRG